MPEKSRNEKPKETASLMQDFLDQLERITRQFPGSRLLVDLARSQVLGMDHLEAISQALQRKENVVLLADTLSWVNDHVWPGPGVSCQDLSYPPVFSQTLL